VDGLATAVPPGVGDWAVHACACGGTGRGQETE